MPKRNIDAKIIGIMADKDRDGHLQASEYISLYKATLENFTLEAFAYCSPKSITMASELSAHSPYQKAAHNRFAAATAEAFPNGVEPLSTSHIEELDRAGDRFRRVSFSCDQSPSLEKAVAAAKLFAIQAGSGLMYDITAVSAAVTPNYISKRTREK